MLARAMSTASIISASMARADSRQGLAREAGWVGAGGAVGALARSALAWCAPSLGWPELAATQAVNLAGAIALGVLVGALEMRGPRPRLRAFLGVGVLGSFTTFSTLVDESRSVAGVTSSGVALAYLTGSLLLGIVAFWLGERTSKLALSRAPRPHDETANTP